MIGLFPRPKVLTDFGQEKVKQKTFAWQVKMSSVKKNQPTNLLFFQIADCKNDNLQQNNVC